MLDSAKTAEDLKAFQELFDETQTEDEDDRWIVHNLAEVADFFGLSIQTIKQWRLESPPMPGIKGAYSVKEIVQWRTERRNGRPSSALSSIDTELKTVQLENKKLDLAIRKKELLDRHDVEQWAAVALIETREMVMVLPEMLATSSPPEHRDFIRNETDRHCRDVLKMLKRRLESDEFNETDTTDETTE